MINFTTRIGLATREDMLRYVEKHMPPADGTTGFLWSVLTNDLRGACRRADDTNRHAIFEVVAWLWDYAPCGCWGSEEAVLTWISGSRLPEQYDLPARARKVLACE